MFGGLLRFRFNQQGTAETDFVFVIDHHLHEAANLLTFLTQVSVEQRFVAFATAPQDVILTTQLMRGIHCGHDLSSGPTEHFRVWVGCRTRAVARVGEAVCRAPQQLHAALLLFFTQIIHHLSKVVQILFKRRAFRRDVNIVEAVIRNVQFVEKLECHIGFAFRQF
ncbi:hypothetical protein D3C71_1625000 [compost metagenome]